MNPAAESLINGIKFSRGLEITLNITGLGNKKIHNDIQLNLYRVLQEQLNNIIKHSRAKNVKVDLTLKDEKARLVIEDDGRGFNPSEVKDGIGLENIKRRTRLFNGYTEINSAPGKGCKLLVELPL